MWKQNRLSFDKCVKIRNSIVFSKELEKWKNLIWRLEVDYGVGESSFYMINLNINFILSILYKSMKIASS